MVNEQSAFGTGQLADKEGQMYHVINDDLYLIPTSEVPITNIYRNDIIEEDDKIIYTVESFKASGGTEYFISENYFVMWNKPK